VDIKDIRDRMNDAAGKVLQTETARNLLSDTRVQRALVQALRLGGQIRAEAKSLGREIRQIRAAIRGPETVDDDLATLKRELDARRAGETSDR
jgi:hypothetical protein